MTAAFGGKIVEKNVKVANFITFVMVTLGWVVTGIRNSIKKSFNYYFRFWCYTRNRFRFWLLNSSKNINGMDA